MAATTPLLNTCTLHATGHLVMGERFRVRLYEGEFELFVAKQLLGRLKRVEGLVRFIFYPRTTAVGDVRLTLARFAPAQESKPSQLHAVGKIRFADGERVVLRIYPNPGGKLKKPFTVQLESQRQVRAHPMLGDVPVKQPVEVWGGLKGEHLTLERLSVLEQLPPRDESYKEKRGRR